MATEICIEDRRARITELMSTHGFMSMTELVQILGVSGSTIRRDLEILEEQGTIRRTHGGAVFVKDSPGQPFAFAEREMTAAMEKRAIARAVADLIPTGQTVILDGGTTCLQVAAALAGRRLSVITNSVHIAARLSSEVATEVTLIGGYVYPRTGVALGAAAERMLDSLHAGQVVLSCAGVTEAGLFNANQMMVDVERKMMQVADEVILAVDHTKFGMPGVVKLCSLAEMDVLVTDSGVHASSRAWLAGLKAKVVFAEDTDGERK